MYVRLREGAAQSLNAIGLDRVAHLNHSYAHALNQSTEDWYTHAAIFACCSAAIFSTAAVTAGS